MSKCKKISKIIINIILWLLALAILYCVGKLLVGQFKQEATFFGDYSILRVTTKSMINSDDESKGINPGEYILIKKVDTKDVKKGDIITFISTDPSIAGRLNTHRVYEVVQPGEKFITKGDNNLSPDNKYPVLADKIVGVMVRKLTVATFIVNAITSNIFVLILLVVVIILFSAISIFKSWNKAKQQDFDMRVQQEVEKLKAQNSTKQPELPSDSQCESQTDNSTNLDLNSNSSISNSNSGGEDNNVQ